MAGGSSVITRVRLSRLAMIFLRSFFTQGSFSPQYRQNLGIAFCLDPAGRELWSDEHDYRAFLSRHTEEYNGNPFMSSLVIGATVHLEEQFRNGEGVTEEDIRRFKRMMGAATGSAGDRLFWGTLRPFALLMGITVALTIGLPGVIVFLALFNLPLIALKIRWFRAGYRQGPKVIAEIKNKRIERIEQVMAQLGCILAGFTAVASVGLTGGGSASPVTLIAASVFFALTALSIVRTGRLSAVTATMIILAAATSMFF